jgi:hypothetical protein
VVAVKHVGLFPFVHLFPRQGTAETRTLSITRSPLLPDGEYGLLESYCVEDGCHCRRVMLNVIGRSQGRVLASVSYGFDRDEEDAGPFLDPLNPQSRYPDVLLNVVAQALADPLYVERLEAHYYQVKGVVHDPSHPCHVMLAKSDGPDHLTLPNRQARRARARKGR